MYATVINGQVVGCSYTIPRVHADIDGFDRLPAAEQLARGIYPMEEVKPDLLTTPIDTGEVDQDNNPVIRHVPTQQYGEATDVVTASKVIRTYSVIARPQADITEEINAPTIKKITLIEAGQARAVREAALGNTTYLAQIEAQIAALRATLV